MTSDDASHGGGRRSARGLGALIPSSARDEAPRQSRRATGRESDAVRPEAGGVADVVPDTVDVTDAVTASRRGASARRSANKPVQESAPSSPQARDLAPVPGMELAELPLTQIRTNPRQPRQVFDEEALQELVHSLREIGLLQPIVVRPIAESELGRLEADAGSAVGDHGEHGDHGDQTADQDKPRFELVAGERRLRASALAGFTTIPALVRQTSDEALLRDALLENLHRAQLNPLEEGAAYQQLLADFGCSQEELAARLGRSRSQISNSMRLLRLPPAVAKRVAAGVLSAGHARALLALDDESAMEAMAQRIVNQGLSVRATEEAVSVASGKGGASRKRGGAGSPRAKRQAPVELQDAGRRLGDVLDTAVDVRPGRGRGAAAGGEIVLHYADVEDFHRLMRVMGAHED